MQVIQRWARRLAPWRPRRPSAADVTLVRSVLADAAQLHALSDRQLAERVAALRATVASGHDPAADAVIAPMFALIHEAVRRSLGVTLYDVQHLAGLALARGQVAQMQTGEGKTYAAALPAALHGLSGRGVHVMTANSYLAERDCTIMRPVYELLGISLGLLTDAADAEPARAAYACDVTYGRGCQFAFDYLRDQVAQQQRQQQRNQSPLGAEFRRLLRGQAAPPIPTLQRGLVWAIIDEADNVLIDDAGSPLILSDRAATPATDAAACLAARGLASRLEQGRDYHVYAQNSQLELTEAGERRIYDDATAIPTRCLLRPWSHYVEQALRAKLLFRRDVQYVVQSGEVQIVDASTGRIFADRSWQAGLHQAIQAKEGLTITAETQPLAQITRQRFFRLYERRGGMTGTALGGERELWRFYRLPVVEVPLRKPTRRTLLPSRYFGTAEAKWLAIADEVSRWHAAGRPVLIGTQTIAESETLAAQLDRRGLPYQLLNGRQDADEARIVAAAGQPRAITVATNITGRGTDIRLAPDVIELGGLHVIAAGRHESGRIDRQLIGRCARQGEPGSAQVFIAAGDALIAKHAPRLAQHMRRWADPHGEVMLDLDRQVRRVQRRAERADYARRRRNFRYDRYRNQVMARFAGEQGSKGGEARRRAT